MFCARLTCTHAHLISQSSSVNRSYVFWCIPFGLGIGSVHAGAACRPLAPSLMIDTIKTIDGYELMTIQDAAKMCGVTFSTVYRWIKDGILPVRKEVGRVRLVDKKEVLKAADSVQKTKPRSGDRK